MIFSGTAATYGRGRAVVTATGMQTEMGRIAGMLKEAPDETTPLQKELDRVGKLLGIIVVVIAVVMIATIILVEDVRGFSAIFDVLILGVALAVAAVPEGLPAVVTAVLSLGVQRMAKRNAIVRHLAAVETLGSANVIASDKTGTLTKNEMTVRVVVTASGRVTFSGTGYAPEGEVRRDGGGAIDGALRFELVRALAAADRANNAVLQERDGRWTVQGDPTEGALIVAARKAGLEDEALDARFARVGGGAVLLRAQADEHGPQRRRAAGAPARAHQGRAGRPARALLARAGRRGGEASDGGASRRDPGDQRGARRRGAAHARGRLPLAAEGRVRARDVRRERRAGPRLPRPDRHDRPAARRGEGRGRAREGRRHPPDHDHGRPPEDRRGHRRRARHRGRRPSRHRRRAREDAGRGARPDGPGGVGLCARQPRAQAADREGAAARRA